MNTWCKSSLKPRGPTLGQVWLLTLVVDLALAVFLYAGFALARSLATETCSVKVQNSWPPLQVSLTTLNDLTAKQNESLTR